MIVRDEEEKDWAAVHSLNASAFETPVEAELVDALRQEAHPIVSLVAEDESVIVGHILFSPVILSGFSHLKIMGLAPMAVSPNRQRSGIGSKLVDAGLKKCRELDYGAVVVLGHPDYYPRFGFSPSTRFGIRSEYDVPDDVFMVVELRPGSLHGAHGTIQYHSAFSKL
jgi:putative acetyltransferase